jgi:hypothetical protein
VNRLERPPAYQSTTGTTRARRTDTRRRIVKEREYLNRELNYADVAVFTYQPKSASSSELKCSQWNPKRPQGSVSHVDPWGHGEADGLAS